MTDDQRESKASASASTSASAPAPTSAHESAATCTPDAVSSHPLQSSVTPAAGAYSPLDPRFCPWCGYDVASAKDADPCPECGLDISQTSRHRALIRRSSTDARSRMILLVSPVFAVAITIPGYAGGGPLGMIVGVASVISIAGMLAIWRIGRTPGASLPLAVILIGGPLLGILYCVVILLFVLGAIIPIVLLSRMNDGNALSPLLMVAIIIVMCLVGAVATLYALRWAFNRLTPRRKRNTD